jgi:outer membrane receptor protein involved in Fe transport
VDLNVEYSFSDKLSVFANARNIFNEQQTRLIYADVTPDYAHVERTEEFGVQFAIGVKGKF